MTHEFVTCPVCGRYVAVEAHRFLPHLFDLQFDNVCVMSNNVYSDGGVDHASS